MPPENVVIRYIGVRNLARKGESNERDNAKAILSTMEAKYPDIRKAVAAYERQQKEGHGAQPNQGTNQPQTKTRNERRAPAMPTMNWEDLFRYGQSFAGGVAGFAQTIGNVVAGRRLGEHVQAGAKVTNLGSLLLQLKIPSAVFEATAQLNQLQLNAFREVLHQKLDDLLDGIFNVEEEEEDDEDED